MLMPITVTDYSCSGWSTAEPSSRARWYCEQLEQGQILYFDRPPFDLPDEDIQFLVGQRQSDSRLHKNISYRPEQDLLRGFSQSDATRDRVHQIMKRYSAQVRDFADRFLSPYAAHRQMDYASFRPLEEEGRDLPLHKRNDLMHVDAFPSRPTRGGRILRIFTNIHPEKERVWVTTDPFAAIAPRMAQDAGLPKFAAAALRSPMAGLMRALRIPGAGRSPYDRFMLHFHDYLKENATFQEKSAKVRTGFPPRATWLVFTDCVPHAVLSGQHALEQTFIIPVTALVAPQISPIRVLEQLAGKALA